MFKEDIKTKSYNKAPFWINLRLIVIKIEKLCVALCSRYPFLKLLSKYKSRYEKDSLFNDGLKTRDLSRVML